MNGNRFLNGEKKLYEAINSGKYTFHDACILFAITEDLAKKAYDRYKSFIETVELYGVEPEVLDYKKCKKIVTVKGVTRQCTRMLWKEHKNDGYCANHHPDSIEKIRLDIIDREKAKANRNIYESTCLRVGQIIYDNDKKLFDRLIIANYECIDAEIKPLKRKEKNIPEGKKSITFRGKTYAVAK